MTFLAMRFETDRLHVAAVRLGLVAIVAIELAGFRRRNVAAIQMARMIETQHIIVAEIVALQLKWRVTFADCVRRPGVSTRRAWELENGVAEVDGRWIQMKAIGPAPVSTLCRS